MSNMTAYTSHQSHKQNTYEAPQLPYSYLCSYLFLVYSKIYQLGLFHLKIQKVHYTWNYRCLVKKEIL